MSFNAHLVLSDKKHELGVFKPLPFGVLARGGKLLLMFTSHCFHAGKQASTAPVSNASDPTEELLRYTTCHDGRGHLYT